MIKSGCWIILSWLWLSGSAFRSAADGIAAPAPRPSPAPVITLAAVGDVLLAGKAAKLSAQQGAGAAFAAVKNTLGPADIAFCNLECPLSGRGGAAKKAYTFHASPLAAEDLRQAGIDLVGLANNHTLDYGRGALQDTLAALKTAGIAWVGAGEDLQQARRVQFFDFGRDPATKTRLAFLAFSNMLPLDFYASEKRGGTTPAWAKLIRQDVARAGKQADFTIVAFHWGKELSDRPTPGQRALAHLAIDSGADLVIGHHPHVLQGGECYKHGFIIYSLGNFVFPSRGKTRESVILLARLQKPKQLTIELQPIWIEGGTPRPAEGKSGEKILRRLAGLTRELGGVLTLREGSACLRPAPESPPRSGLGLPGEQHLDKTPEAGNGHLALHYGRAQGLAPDFGYAFD
jgi:poly-gamma-glutamate capsule biosynthesis protein CapA/YwtB (metallophosphatase superfamily)